MNKGLDSRFLHYGIRREDLEVIETLCHKHELEPEWVKEEVLRAYHAQRVDSIEMNDDDAERVIHNAIQKIN